MSRIAFVSVLESLPWGGCEELWSQAAPLLRARGHDVGASVQWWPQTPAPLQELESAGVLLHRRRIRARAKLLLGERAEQKNFRWLDEWKPDLVVLSLDSQSAGRKWMQACRERNLPYALIVQAVIEHLWPGDFINEHLTQGYREARAIFHLSPRNLEWLQTQFAHALPQAQLVFNPFNVSYEATLPWPESQRTLRLACVGRLDPVAKGQDILFEVLRQPKWKNRALEVSLFGSGGYEKALRALQEYSGLANVRFAGFTNSVESIWRDHHALVLPSRFEGLPLAVVEAMLCARPCVVTDVAGNAELLEDNVSGFIAAAPKAEFVDDALERLWQKWQNHELQKCGQIAAEQVRKKVPQNPAQKFAQQLEALL